MKTIKSLYFLLFIALLHGCEELEVENLNEPETARVLSTPDDFINVLDGASLQFWNAVHKYSPYMTLSVAAEH